jgi:hypothetical protein
MSRFRQLVKMKKESVVFSHNGVAKILFSLPRTATLLSIDVLVKTAFNDSGTDLLRIGTQLDDDHFVTDFSVGSLGFTRCTMVLGGPMEDLLLFGPAVDIFATYYGQNGDVTAGEAVVMITYADPFTNPA